VPTRASKIGFDENLDEGSQFQALGGLHMNIASVVRCFDVVVVVGSEFAPDEWAAGATEIRT